VNLRRIPSWLLPARRRRTRPDAMTPLGNVLGGLKRAGDEPDLSGEIMGRLGYQRVPNAATRRRRRAKRLVRTATVTGLLLAVMLGGLLRYGAPDARRVEGPTVQEALGREVEQQRTRFNRTFQTIRNLVPQPAETHGPRQDVIDEDVDRSAIAPVVWL